MTLLRTRAELAQMRADLEVWAITNPLVARRVFREYMANRVCLAREDVNEFMEFVMVDDRTNEPILQEYVHEEFQDLADRHKRLIVWGHVESGKTTQLAIGRTLWRLGREPNLHVAIVASAAKNQSQKIGQALKAHIERNRRLRMVFPNLRPGGMWGASSFTIDRRSYAKDPTVQTTSQGTSSLTGARIDLMIIDDLVTFQNTRTADQRLLTLQWVQSAGVMGRLSEDSQLIFLGNAFHPEDAMHQLAKLPGFYFAKFPVIDADGNLTWPDRWPQKRIDEWRRDWHPDEFARQLLCVARDDSSGRFKREWIDACLARGLGKRMANQLGSLPPGYSVFTGVDLGHRKKKKSDQTVLFTIVVHPNEDREVVNVESGRKAGNEIVNAVINNYDRYNSLVYVENNGAQQYIVDFVKDQSAVPCKPVFTGKNKLDPVFGIEGLATEVSNHKWIIPNDGPGRIHPELAAWIDEMIYYDPQSHAGDRLMASWIAREGARLWTKRPRMRSGRIVTLNR